MRWRTRDWFDPDIPEPTDKQRQFLERHKLTGDQATNYYDASAKISQFVRDRRALPPTDRQRQLLVKYGRWREGMNRGQAFDLIRDITDRKSRLD